MPFFKYTVRDKAGKVSKGTLEGPDLAAVRSRLSETGLVMLDISEEAKFGISSLNRIKFGSGVKRKEVAIFSRQFSTMITAGLSLTKCLSILGAQSESVGMKEIIKDLQRDVESGLSLSESMGKHAKVFPPIFINMVKAGETGGVLDEVLIRVADHFEADLALKAKIKSAMTYPIAMFVLVFLILIAMLVFVVPVFQKMFADMGGELPLPTQILVNVSNLVKGPGGLVALVVATGLYFAFKYWTGTPSGNYIWDAIKLKMPVIGPIVRKLALARFTRTLSTLVSAGVPILNALEIVAETAGNAVVSKGVKTARMAIKEGEPIYKPLSENKVFPPMLVQMVAVGEETGALDTVLDKVADFYDDEVANTVDSLTSIIEPIMMAIMGLVVGGMVIALYMPMFSIIAVVQEQGS